MKGFRPGRWTSSGSRCGADNAAGTYGGRVQTRFPPEPNGFPHIGHAKAVCLNFEVAAEHGGTCRLRFDDTNPEGEDAAYAEAIADDIAWLGYEPDGPAVHASDYFEELYGWAEHLVGEGLAYVDDQDAETISATRGDFNTPGVESGCRDRSVEENLSLLRAMRAGRFSDGEKVLRARIDMAHPNMLMRDPVMYRIRHIPHFRTGDAWCIYPTYDWAHGQSDAIEGVTHSLCSLEFDAHRQLYDWYLEHLPLPGDRPPPVRVRPPEPHPHSHLQAQAERPDHGRTGGRLGRPPACQPCGACAGGATRPRPSGSSVPTSAWPG